MEHLSKRWLGLVAIAALVGLLAVLAACGGKATPTATPIPPTATRVPPPSTPIPPTATATRIPATATPTRVAATPTPLPPGVTPPPATSTPTPVPPTSTPTPKPKEPLPGPGPVDTISDAEWAKIVEAAKKEGKVTCYCWQFGARWKLDWATKAFKEAYGIDLEVLGFSGVISTERIKSEARAGKYMADVFGAMTAYHPAMEQTGLLKRADNLPALKDARDPSLWYFNPIMSPYSISTVDAIQRPAAHFYYNSKVVPPERLPRKWQDLLDPWWQTTKICTYDPLTAGSNDWGFWGYWLELGYKDATWWPDFAYDFWQKGKYVYLQILGSPNPVFTGDCGLSGSDTWQGATTAALKSHVVDGKVTWTKLWTMPDQKHPIRFTVGQAQSLLATSPHPNAAMVFQNWITSKEGQQSYSKLALGAVLRKDVPFLIEKQYYPEDPATTFWLPDFKWFGFEGYSYANKLMTKLMKEGMSKEAFSKAMRDTSTTYWGQFPPPQYPIFSVEE